MRKITKGQLAMLALAALFSIALAAPANALMLVSKSQEVAIGKEVQAQVIKQYGGLSHDSVQTARIQQVGKKIAAVSPRKNISYSYQVLNSNVINAFSAPGGPVMVTDKLARMMTTNDQLAFVLGHETGHIAAEHGRDAINRAMLAQGISSLLFGKSSQMTQLGINIMYTLYDRGYSRSQEYQADALGVQMMRAAGYNPEAAIIALAKLGMDKSSGVNKYMATHPDVPDRINRVAQQTGISPQRAQQLIQQAQNQMAQRKAG